MNTAVWSALLAMVLALFKAAMPANAQQIGAIEIEQLRSNTKLHAPDEILADFVGGVPETSVIVLLRPSAAAGALAIRSQASARVPDEFNGPGAAVYYDLQDQTVRAQLHSEVAAASRLAIQGLGTSGLTVTRRFSYQFGFSARVTPAALERLVNSPDVVAIEKDAILQPHLAQGIPLMNASTVRGSYTGLGVSIAICDTGIDTSHPRLGGGGFPNTKVIGGYDTGNSDADPRPDPYTGEAHGTACAGIAAGNMGTAGDYIGGVAPEAKLYSIKISNDTTGTATASSIITGWEWCVTHKNDDPANPILIISTSFGGGRYFASCDSASSAMTTAAANAVAAGITLFASAGNDGYCDSIAWPACISYVNSVGAVYDASFGTYYPCVSNASCAVKTPGGCSTGYFATDNTRPDKVPSYSNSASFLTLFAPSNRASTTDIVGFSGYSSGDYYTNFGGTSAAAPYAAGAAAMLQQAVKVAAGSYLTPAQVRSYFVGAGDNVTDGKVAVTKPRINLGRAIATLPKIVLTVASTNPASGVAITVSPNDTDGLNNGTTPFTRSYAYGAAVTLTAPLTAAGIPFGNWVGCTSAAGTTCSVAMDVTKTVRAYFRAASVTAQVNNDFDGDGHSDVGCYYPAGGNWYGVKSTAGFWQTQFGYAGTRPITGDFDGDGKSDIGCYFPDSGNWYVMKSSEGFWRTQFGYAGTIPVVGDFDGDGRSDIGCYFPDGGNWYVMKSSEGFWQTQFGYAGTIPVVGDFDGDGRSDIGCYYAAGGNWYVMKSTEGFWQTQFGYDGTVPVVGDFDGDGRDDIGVYYPAGGNWYVLKSKEGFWQTQFGYSGTEPVVGDFDGDGRDDIAVYYPPGGLWYIRKSKEGFWQTQFGYAGTIPLGGTLR